jgi:hypothetical protein
VCAAVPADFLESGFAVLSNFRVYQGAVSQSNQMHFMLHGLSGKSVESGSENIGSDWI